MQESLAKIDPFFEEKFAGTMTPWLDRLEGKFAPHCERNVLIADLLHDLGEHQRAQRIFDCGHFQKWLVPVDLSEKPFLLEASFCRDRICSMCTWRRSLKIFSQVSRVMNEIQDDYRFIFLTLTLRNVPSGGLSDAIDHLNQAFNLFQTYADVRRSFKGSFRVLELTRNPTVARFEWHPHLHMIVAVDKQDYFGGKEYLTHKKLRYLWGRALNDYYAPQVFIETVKHKPKQELEDVSEDMIGEGSGDQFAEIVERESDDGSSMKTRSFAKALLEVTKYTLKNEDLFKGSRETQLRSVRTVADALKGRRLCAFTGIFKKVAKQLKLDDLENGDLTDRDRIRNDVAYFVYNCSWGAGYGYHTELDRRKPIRTGEDLKAEIESRKVRGALAAFMKKMGDKAK